MGKPETLLSVEELQSQVIALERRVRELEACYGLFSDLRFQLHEAFPTLFPKPNR
jgi:hypothetical protein